MNGNNDYKNAPFEDTEIPSSPPYWQTSASTTTAVATSSPRRFQPRFLSPTSRYRLLWNLFGREVLAVVLALLEVGLLVWSGFTQWTQIFYSTSMDSIHFNVAITYFVRAFCEVVSLVAAISMGKYRRVGSTPLAFEWQPSNVVDSIIITFLIFSSGLTSMSLFSHFVHDYYFYTNTPMILTVLSSIPIATSLGFGAWFITKRKELVKNGPITLTFNVYARNLAISYEMYGALFDLVVVVVADNFATSLATLLIELLRTAWEIIQDIKDFKACYSFGKLYLPLSAIPLLESINTNRAEALKSNIDLDGVVLVSGARITTEELVSRILAALKPLSSGPIGGSYWYEALGGQTRDFRFPAWLAVQPTLDSIHAWMDSDEVTINFDTLGIQLSSRFDLDGLCGYSAKTRTIDRDGRITKTSIWNDHDPNRSTQPIQLGPNLSSLHHIPHPSTSGQNLQSPPTFQSSSTGSSVSSIPQGSPGVTGFNGNYAGATNGCTSSHNSPPYVLTSPSSPPPLVGMMSNSSQQTTTTSAPSSSCGSGGGSPHHCFNIVVPTTSSSSGNGVVGTPTTLMERLVHLEKMFGLIRTAADTVATVDGLWAKSRGEEQSHSNEDDTEQPSDAVMKRVKVLENSCGLTSSAGTKISSIKTRVEEMELLVQQVVNVEEILGMDHSPEDKLYHRIALIEDQIGLEDVDVAASLFQRIENIQQTLLQ